MRWLKRIVKWTGYSLLGLLLLAALGYVYVYLSTERRISKQYTYKSRELSLPQDSASLARGAHLYQIRSCADCHGDRLQGSTFMNDASLLRLSAPNLTRGRGGLPLSFSTADWWRVLRHGVNANGRSLWMMPSQENAGLSQQDLACLIAYCEQAAPVDSDSPRLHSMGPVGRVLMVLDQVAVLPAERIDHDAAIALLNPNGAVATGKYLASVCEGCHRSNMKGGGPLAPGFPPVPDISASGAPGSWTDVQFVKTIREGVTPEGRKLRNEFMPWQNMKSFSDEELHAIRSYLHSL